MRASLLASLSSRVSARSSITARFAPAALRPVARKYTTSTEPAAAESTAAAQAQSLINIFPGETPAAKATSVLLSSSVAAYLVSKEIYALDGEIFELAAIFGAYYMWYSGGKEGFVEYFSDKQTTIRNVLTAAREQHHAVVKERMDHIGKLANSVEVTKGLFEISKEIAKLEAEAYELKQRVAYTSEVKSVLDSWVRHEASVREKEQKLMAETIINKIRAELSDPRMQSSILAQTIADVEAVTKAK
ncbi:atp4 subunit B of the stator stalk of mitochondrial F1F0 ATP synthase [Chytriomyces hyalinus]|nr:atp4 subunit B of the stator stalk of mitochondrial F1F0 ATP synthase [Chytriomyces hyalinus]